MKKEIEVMVYLKTNIPKKPDSSFYFRVLFIAKKTNIFSPTPAFRKKKYVSSMKVNL